MAEREYKRLTNSRSRTVSGVFTTSRSSLWLGKDHILCIDTSGYSETYKRFFFRDIQALVIRRNPRWFIASLILGAMAAVFGAVALWAVSLREPGLAWFMAGVMALFLVSVALNLFLGPTCDCHIRTAVQTEQLPALNRVGRARKLLARVRPLLAEAQGPLAPEEVPARMQAWLAESLTVGTAPARTAGYVVDDPNAPPRIVS